MSKKLVYIGPSRPFGLPVMQNAILAGEPEEVFPQSAKFLEEHRNFRRLFVPVPDLAAARAALGKAGSPLSLCLDEVKKASDDFKRGVA